MGSPFAASLAGREHGVPIDAREHVRRPLVRREVEAADQLAGVEGGDHFLRGSAKELRTTGVELERAQRVSCLVCQRPGRDVDRHDQRRGYFADPTNRRWLTRLPSRRHRCQDETGQRWLWSWALAVPVSSKYPTRPSSSSAGPRPGTTSSWSRTRTAGRSYRPAPAIHLRGRVPQGRAVRGYGAQGDPGRRPAPPDGEASAVQRDQFVGIPEFPMIGTRSDSRWRRRWSGHDHRQGPGSGPGEDRTHACGRAQPAQVPNLIFMASSRNRGRGNLRA